MSTSGIMPLALLTAAIALACAGKPPSGSQTAWSDTPSISECLMGKVCVDDVLRIDVDGDGALSGSYRVDPGGGIDYPFLGRLSVSGLTPAAVANSIAAGLKKARTGEPKVSVEIDTDHEAAQERRRRLRIQ